jgi:hypothetical protein
MSREEFEDALRKGLGRAFVHVSEHGLSQVKDLVLEACIKNQLYDRQCEGDRNAWLHAMFHNSPFHEEFRSIILDRLLIEEETWNLSQLFGITLIMAEKGDELARQRLRIRAMKIANESSSHEWMGSRELIALDGEEGWIELVRAYGRRLLADPDTWVPGDLSDFHDDTFRLKAVQEWAVQEEVIMAYRNYLAKQGVFDAASTEDRPSAEEEAAKRREQSRANLPLQKLLQNAQDKCGQYPGNYLRFARHATPEELLKVYEHLIDETDDEVRVRLLWVFRRIPLPQLDECIFQWVYSTHDDLREAAITALSHSEDTRIHELARALCVEPNLTKVEGNLPLLFIHHYGGEEDATLITSALKGLNLDAYGLHYWGYSLLDLADKHSDPALAEALRWVYEKTPCSYCRSCALDNLHKMNQLSPEILEECQYDGSEEIRQFARERLEQSVAHSSGASISVPSGSSKVL